MTEQSTRRRRGWWGLLTLLLLASAAGYALSSSPSASTATDKPSAGSSSLVLAPAASTNNGNAGSNDNCVEPSNSNGNCLKTFGVTVGQVPTLYPTLVRQVPVTYSNPYNFDISVTTYRVTVSVPSSQSTVCPASSLQTPAGTITLASALTVPKKDTASTTFPVQLPADAPEGCQDVTFSITVNASAVKK